MSRESLVPPLSTNPKGEPRRVGVEIELNNLSVEQICKTVEESFGGTTRFASEYEAKVETDSGAFDVLVDAKWALKLAGPKVGANEEAPEPLSTRFLKSLADLVVPLEIVTPPLPITSIPDLDLVVAKLGRQGGRGTNERVMNAFGVHFNPELPGFEPELIVRYLRSFVVLRDWLLQTIEVDLTRRATPFIDRYPVEYANLVLDADYRPTQAEMIDDYLHHNPTRNRALDMLPLFGHLDGGRVKAALPDEKNNPRPTFHYRMANSRVGEPDWSISAEWRSWLEVERLAVNRELLHELAIEYRTLLGKPIDSLLTDWGREVARRVEGADD